MNLRTCLLGIASISLVIFPYKFSSFLRRTCSYIASYRFKILIGAKGSLFLQQPFYVRGHKYIQIGEHFFADASFRIECWDYYMGHSYKPSIIIGENVCFNYRCHIGAIEKICIGNNVLVGSQVLITDHSHGELTEKDLLISPAKRKLYSKGPVIIGDNVWIGEGVCILPNVTIGNNCVIGANSVVTKNVPPFSIVGGNPAKVIRSIGVRNNFDWA